MTAATNRYFGSPVLRNEDAPLLTGAAMFVDDIDFSDMLHVAFLRSPHAHARIEKIDTTATQKCDGVVAVFTADDLGAFWAPSPLVVPPPPIEDLVFNQRTQTPLARDVVRYVGEPVALVVAENRYLAEDALDRIVVDYDPLPVAAELEPSAQVDAPMVHDVRGNVAAEVRQVKGDYNLAKNNADVVIARRFLYEHGLAQPIETRGIVARWDTKAEHLSVWAATQTPTSLHGGLAQLMGLGSHQIRVVAPFVGGGFGSKLLMYYPEELMVPWAARELGSSLKWIEDRSEHFVATSQERGQIHDAEIAVSQDGKILGLKDVFLHDNGAYNPYGLTVPINSQCAVLGPYVVPAYDSSFKAIFTNKPIVAPFRGAGRQHGVFVIERLLDIAARQLGIDRVEIRRRNLIPSDAFPYKNGIMFQDFTELQYDSGNYLPILERTLEIIGYESFVRDEQPILRAEGKCVGIGVVCYVEGTGIGPYEGAKVQVDPSGRVHVATGIGTQGQSHFTSFAQIAADLLGVAVDEVDVTTGDTDQFGWGAGTFASRGAVVAGNAVHEACSAVREKILNLAAEHFECSSQQLSIENGEVQTLDKPDQSITIGELAVLANPMRGAVKPGTEPGLQATRYFGPEAGTTASGAHAMIVEVDRETMMVKILKYVVVHDCGTPINPMVVEGQIHGGVAQGIGNAFYEKVMYDDAGQIMNATLADYLIPTSMDVPVIELDHIETPSTMNPLGIKGVGEAGAIPVAPAFAQAVEDALGIAEGGSEILEIPLSPNRLWELAEGGTQ
ncbi:MAG: xanthine dehydrogenase family protein molybdopterin-binding subunit [Alphaproteobacteria bacterium]|nr:xanthine dehydrogenase family protein molybdopterin-binding subunit [Alphaproteobacteria bacterium]